MTVFGLHLFVCQSQLRAFFPSNRLLETNNKHLNLNFVFLTLPMGFASGNTVWKSCFSICGRERMYRIACYKRRSEELSWINNTENTSSLVILLRVSFVGVPQILRTFVIWSISKHVMGKSPAANIYSLLTIVPREKWSASEKLSHNTTLDIFRVNFWCDLE